MKLKSDITISFNVEKDAYEFDFSQSKKVGKITSRLFPILLGKNGFNGIGYGILDRVGFLEREEIDPYYTVRGAVGEYMVNLFIIDSYKKRGIDIVTKQFSSMISYDGGRTFYGNDLFKKNERFGGVVDIGISSPDEYRATIEVKSKSMKDLEYIITKNYVPEEEILQGLQLAYLSNSMKLLMVYIFFTPKQEENLKLLVPTIKNVNNFDIKELVDGLRWELKDFTIKPIPYKVDRQQVEKDMEQAYTTLHTTVESGVIPREYFREKEITYLNDMANYEEHKPITDDSDLPY
jgi:hypothetical protein